MGTTTPRRVMPTDWKAQLEAANRRIAEIEGKVAVQHDTLQRLSAEGADTQAVTRMLDVLKQSLERATSTSASSRPDSTWRPKPRATVGSVLDLMA